MVSISKNGHLSVLLHQAVEMLGVRPGGVYVDATFGRGGHSSVILERMGALEKGGKLIAFDVDPDAVSFAKQHIKDPRFHIIHANFSALKDTLNQLGIFEVDGVLADLGVSSPQIDVPERGFSFQANASLDMRMNPQFGEPVSVWLNQAPLTEITAVLREYGEEPHASRISRKLIEKRQLTPIVTTFDLVEVVLEALNLKSWKGHHPATRTFQALRIFINQEIDSLDLFLKQVPHVLKVHGKWVIIAFHSLEDRRVKHCFHELVGHQGHVWEKKNPHQVPVLEKLEQASWKLLKKTLAKEENENNQRARSAVMRGIECLRKSA